jgi:hypothetical protein
MQKIYVYPGMVFPFTPKELEVSPYLDALMKSKDSGSISVDMHDDAISIDTDEFSRVEWLSYAQYLITGDIHVGTMKNILSYMGHTFPSDDAPEEYRSAYMKDVWGSNKGIDGLYFCKKERCCQCNTQMCCISRCSNPYKETELRS